MSVPPVDGATSPAKLPCCPACVKDGPPEWIRELGKCCCFHTPPRTFEG